MTPNDIIVEKFHACTGVQRHLIQQWLNCKDSLSHIEGIDLEKILPRIESLGLQQYGNLIIRYLDFQRGNIGLLKEQSQKLTEIQEESDKRRKLKEELTDSLRLILQNDSITSFQFNTAKGSATVTNQKLITRITRMIKKEFLANGFNVTSMTIEEAEKVYCDNSDTEWFESWKQQLELYDETGNQVAFDELLPDKKYYSDATGQFHDLKYLREEMLNVYAQEHQIARAIDKLLIKILKSEPYQAKDKGRLEKNRRITLITYAIADLARVDEFISRTDISGIDDIEVKNIIGTLVYDLLVSFGMTEHKPDVFNKKYKPHNKIKSLINNKKKSEKFDFQMFLRTKRLSSLKEAFQQL